jgi:hypothetical protein
MYCNVLFRCMNSLCCNSNVKCVENCLYVKEKVSQLTYSLLHLLTILFPSHDTSAKSLFLVASAILQFTSVFLGELDIGTV